MKQKDFRISKNFKLSEFTKQNGVDFMLFDIDSILNISSLCCNILQPISDKLNYKITVSSGFRTVVHNESVGGADNSQHLVGEAADIICQNLREVFEFIKTSLIFDQLIFEYSKKTKTFWIHVSYKRFGINRMMVIDNLIKK
jgi:zinc D-Ala-D-Ala carboxypeptidase